MRGLDPRIHDEVRHLRTLGSSWLSGFMDCQVKPGNDSGLSCQSNYAALLRPHSLAEAMSAPLRMAASLSHTTGSITHSRLVKVPKPQSVDAITRSRSPTARTASSMRRAT